MSEKRDEMSAERAPRRGRPPNRKESGRSRRVPMGIRQSKLTVSDEVIGPDYVGRWINDIPGRLSRAEQGGWEFVEDPTAHVGEASDDGKSSAGSRISRQVGTDDNGKPLFAYLMRIKREWYEEDQEQKQESIRDTENSIKSGAYQQKAGDGRYVPEEGISIK